LRYPRIPTVFFIHIISISSSFSSPFPKIASITKPHRCLFHILALKEHKMPGVGKRRTSNPHFASRSSCFLTVASTSISRAATPLPPRKSARLVRASHGARGGLIVNTDNSLREVWCLLWSAKYALKKCGGKSKEKNEWRGEVLKNGKI
jgi:hypothetical protein